MPLIKIKQDLLHDGRNISDLIAYFTRVYTGCLKKFARIQRTVKSVQSILSHLITTSVLGAMFTHFLVEHG